MIARLDVTPNTTEQNQIRAGKSKAEVTNIFFKLRSRYCTTEANYTDRNLRSITRPLYDSRATCCKDVTYQLLVESLVALPSNGSCDTRAWNRSRKRMCLTYSTTVWHLSSSRMRGRSSPLPAATKTSSTLSITPRT